MNFNSGWDKMTSYGTINFRSMSLFYVPNQPMALWLSSQVVQELLKPLSDKKAPDRARLGALTCLALLAEQREGAKLST